MPRYAEPFGQQLAEALKRSGVSQRELARRLDPQKLESRRRWVGKLLSNEVEVPERESIAAIEQALDLSPGFFKVRPAVRPLNRKDRLAQLEAKALTVDDLQPLLRVVQLLAAGKRAEAQRALSEAGLAG